MNAFLAANGANETTATSLAAGEVTFKDLLCVRDDECRAILKPLFDDDDEATVSKLVDARKNFTISVKTVFQGDLRKIRIKPTFADLLRNIQKTFRMPGRIRLTYLESGDGSDEVSRHNFRLMVA